MTYLDTRADPEGGSQNRAPGRGGIARCRCVRFLNTELDGFGHPQKALKRMQKGLKRLQKSSRGGALARNKSAIFWGPLHFTPRESQESSLKRTQKAL